jgi:hypothetical protein
VASDSRGLILRYERIAELGELELELVRTGQYEQLEALDTERQELVATLPATPPAEAQPALLRAAAVQSQVEGLLSGAVAHTRAALVRLERGKEVLGAYAPAPARPARRVDASG